MPKKAGPLSNLGAISEYGGAYFAHVQYREGSGKKVNFYGPARTVKSQAEKDLEDIRACGALFDEDRDKGLEAMKAEARRIQERAAHEREIRHALFLRGPSGFDSDSDDVDDPAINDPDEWWQDLEINVVAYDSLSHKVLDPLEKRQSQFYVML